MGDVLTCLAAGAMVITMFLVGLKIAIAAPNVDVSVDSILTETRRWAQTLRLIAFLAGLLRKGNIWICLASATAAGFGWAANICTGNEIFRGAKEIILRFFDFLEHRAKGPAASNAFVQESVRISA